MTLPQNKMKEIIDFYNKGQFKKVVEKAEEKACHLAPSTILFNIIAVANARLGNFDKAIENFRKILDINSQDALVYYNIGNIYREKNDYTSEIDCYRKALLIQPNHVQSYNNMGNAFKAKGDLTTAIEKYKKAIKIKLNFAEAHYNLGVALQEKGDISAAIKSYKQACKFKHNYVKAYFNMGNALKDQGDLNAAIYSFKEAINIKPDYAEAYNNLGICFSDICDLDSAINNYNQAIKINPRYAEAYLNLGNSFKDLGYLDAALNSFQKAIEIKPDYVDANFNESLLYLYKNFFENGWTQYEWRLKKESPDNMQLQSTKPKWHSFDKNRVLLWAEQGVGDEIMFASIIPDLHRYCTRLIVQIDKRLIPLFERSFPEDIVFWPSNEMVPEGEYDAHIPMGSLPLHFRQTIDCFKPTSNGWLTACDKKAKRLRRKIVSNDSETLIGISWHSTKPRSGAEKKVIALSQIARKLQAPKVKLVSLQYGDVDNEIEKLQKKYNIEIIQISEVDNKADLDGLASLIMACDSVVSISNSTAHLAGALGKEVQVLLAFSCDWRWGESGNRSYWYRSALLNRQIKIDDWDSALGYF